MANRNYQHGSNAASGYFTQHGESSRPRLPQLPSIHNLNSPSAMGYGAYSPLLAPDHNALAGPHSSDGQTPPDLRPEATPLPIAEIATGKEKAGGASDFVKKLYK